MRAGNMMRLIPITGWSPGELERRWNETPGSGCHGSRSRSKALQNEQPGALRDDERATLLALADDLPQLWNHPTRVQRKPASGFLRAVLKEIMVTVAARSAAPRAALAGRGSHAA